MKLAGDLREFSLPDFLQIQSTAGRTAAVKVMAPEGVGVIHLDAGRVVHAQFGELDGERALLGLLGVRSGYFETAAGVAAPRRTIDAPLSRLILDYAALEAAGLVPRPAGESRSPSEALAGSASARLDTEGGAAPGAARSEGRLPSILALVVASLAGLVLTIFFALGRSSAPLGAQARPEVSRVPVEVSRLVPPADTLPQLLAGEPPAAPASDLAVVPMVICRVLINEQGEVAEAKVFRSRVELAAFEEAAVAAVQGYRFSPAQQAGAPVPVWLNLPVTFR